jgi:uncharacterized protein YukE
MLAFLKKNKEASMSAPIDSIERKSDDESGEYDGLESAMEELHQALLAKNYKGAAQIFRDAAEICDSEPHSEGPHTNG